MSKRQVKLLLKEMKAQNYDHPSIRNAYSILGLTPEDIAPKKLEDFEGNFLDKEIAELRYAHYKSRRKARLRKIADFLIEIESPSTDRTSIKNSIFQEFSEKYIYSERQKFHRHLQVQENQHEISKKSELRKKEIERTLSIKQSKAEITKKANEEEIRNRSHKHSEKVEGILNKKQLELKLQETYALKSPYTERRSLVRTPVLKSRPLIHTRAKENSVDEHLEEIHKKFEASEDLHNAYLQQRACAVSRSSLERIRRNKSIIDAENQLKSAVSVEKIYHKQEMSKMRRSEHIKQKSSKIKKSLNERKQKAFDRKMKQTESPGRQNSCREKDFKIYKARRSIFTRNRQQSQFLAEKYLLKKKNVEENLRIHKALREKSSDRIIDKYREADLYRERVKATEEQMKIIKSNFSQALLKNKEKTHDKLKNRL